MEATTELHFKGNFNLRYANDIISYTPEQQIEIGKCAASPEYFFRNYIRILDLNEEQLVLFKPRKYQITFAEMMIRDRYTIAKWARQSGKSTVVAATMVWLTLFTPNYRILIAANKLAKAKEILEFYKQMYEYLPQWLKHGVKRWGMQSVLLGNGSYVNTVGTSGSAGRGGTYHMLYLDEFAHVPTHIADDFFKSVVPAISSGKTTKIVITSTPKGLNYFHKIWDDSEKGKNDYARSDINWWDVPGRDEEWKRKQIEAYGEDFFKQEFASQFIGSSDTLISGEKLAALTYSAPIIKMSNLDVYEEPVKGHTYAITADMGEGIGKDYSVAMCFDITTLPYRVVCVFRSNTITTLQMPGYLYNMGKHYNESMILIETASEGLQAANILHYDMEYPYVISTKTTQKYGQKISGGFGGGSRFGLKMTAQVKAIGCATLKTMIEQDRLIINDHTLLQELYRFTKDGKTFKASDGHDDHVMCCVSLGWLADQGYIRNINNVDLRHDIAEAHRKEMVDRAAPLMVHQDMDTTLQDQAELLNAARGNFMFPADRDPEMDPDIAEYLRRRF